MAKRFAIRPDQAGYTVFDSWTGLTAMVGAIPQDGLALDDAEVAAGMLNSALEPAATLTPEAWHALLADWRRAYDAIAAFSLFDEGVLQNAGLAELERLREHERLARDRVDGFLRSLR